jgi:hypothetical protein
MRAIDQNILPSVSETPKCSIAISLGNSSLDFCPGLIYIETPGISFKIAKNN